VDKDNGVGGRGGRIREKGGWWKGMEEDEGGRGGVDRWGGRRVREGERGGGLGGGRGRRGWTARGE